MEQRVRAIVERAAADSRENRMHHVGDEPAWGPALVGFASGDDPLFAFFKRDIGEFYWAPQEIFALTFGEAVDPASLSVISWVLPQTAATRSDQRAATSIPARRWVDSKAYWPELTRDVHGTVVSCLADLGVRAVAPETSPHWSEAESQTYGLASTWSQRHTAFVAGLGTFGLSDGLITPVGKSMRAGSVVVGARLEPTPRRYTRHQEWCAFYADGSCGECMERCPAGAITAHGHNKVVCDAYQRKQVAPRIEQLVGARGGGCGLCQAGVQCESGLPSSVRSPEVDRLHRSAYD